MTPAGRAEQGERPNGREKPECFAEFRDADFTWEQSELSEIVCRAVHMHGEIRLAHLSDNS